MGNNHFFLLILFSLTNLNLFAQNSKVIIHDTIEHFEGETNISVIQLAKGNFFVRIVKNDSTILFKQYTQNNILVGAIETNVLGEHNGKYYNYDTLGQTQTYGIASKGNIIESYTLNKNKDTVKVEKKLNDSIVYHFELKNGCKIEYYTTISLIYNGVYKKTDSLKGNILITGTYKAIKKSQIYDFKKYSSLQEKYNLSYSFRGILLETEIPIGNWYYYDDKGKLLQIKKYEWKNCITDM